MSQIKVDQITDEAGTGAPDFPNGITGTVPAASITGALNATGDAPIYACRAWVNFNGTGTVAIRASGNVSSITDNGAGNYTVNFTTAMPDVNYCVSTGSALSATVMGVACPVEYLAGSVRLLTSQAGSGNILAATFADHLNVNVSIFR
jgi:hypothetical protein